MKIILDTNIIFSALLNSNGVISQLIFNANKKIEFYSNSYMRFEIDKHWHKLEKLSKLSPFELKEAQYRLFKKIKFIDEALIPKRTWLYAEKLMQDIDIDDTDFIALTEHLKASLWTGDKELYNGLKKKKYKRVFNTSEIKTILTART